MARYAEFITDLTAPFEDMHVVHVFAVQAFPDEDEQARPLERLRIRNDKLFKAARWVQRPNGPFRTRAEVAKSDRLSAEFLSSHRAFGRYYVASRADHFAHEQGLNGRQDVRWTAQSLRGQQFSELLYRLYARSLAIFGDKAARDLYVFELPIDGVPDGVVPYALHRKPDASSQSVRVRLFAVGKQLSDQGMGLLANWMLDCTVFSSVVAIALVISPDWASQSRAEGMCSIADVALHLDGIQLGAKGEPIGAFAMSSVAPLVKGCKAYHRKKWWRGDESDWGTLRSLELTKFSACLVGLNEALVPQSSLIDPSTLHSMSIETRGEKRNLVSDWWTFFAHFVTGICDANFRLTTSPNVDVDDGALRCETMFHNIKLEDLRKTFLPKGSKVSLRSDTLTIVSPGRKLLMKSVTDEQAAIQRNSRPAAEIGNASFNDHHLLDSVAYNVLLLGLVATEEALLSNYHAELSRSANIKHVRDALNDFDDFYDVSLFDLPDSAEYEEAFAEFKDSIRLDQQYKALDDKLDIIQEGLSLDNLRLIRWTVGLTVSLFALTLWLISFAKVSWADVADLRCRSVLVIDKVEDAKEWEKCDDEARNAAGWFGFIPPISAPWTHVYHAKHVNDASPAPVVKPRHHH